MRLESHVAMVMSELILVGLLWVFVGTHCLKWWGFFVLNRD